jgi:RND family efflux transporter MFP subunit
MSTLSRNWLGAGLLLAVLIVTYLLLDRGTQEHDPSPRQAENHFQLTVRLVELREMPRLYPVPGQVVPAQDIQITSRVSGFIEGIAVQEGEVVDAGSLLVEVDASGVEAAITQSEAAIQAAKSELQDALADVRRFEKLAQTQVVAEERLQKARLRRDQARAALAQAEAELKEHLADSSYTRLTSPVRARVVDRLRDPGDLAGVGTPILHLESLDDLHFETFVPSHHLRNINIGQKVEVRLDDLTEPLTGHITHLVSSADAVTRRCRVKIALPNIEGLLPGQFGQAQLVLGYEPVPVIPPNALVERAGIEGVFVLDDDGIARFRSVRAGRDWDDGREVLAGVETGESIILSPPRQLHEGARVATATTSDL